MRAMPVQSAEDRVEHDPQLKAPGMYRDSSTRCWGDARCRPPRSRCRRRRRSIGASPLIGQHTREIIKGMLGLSLEEMREGYGDGTFWPRAAPLRYLEDALERAQPETSPDNLRAVGRTASAGAGRREGSVLRQADGDLGADVIKIEPPGGEPCAGSVRSSTTSRIPTAASRSGTTTPPSGGSRSTSRRAEGRSYSGVSPRQPMSS